MSDWTFDGFGPEFDAHVVAHLPQYDMAHGVVDHAASYALPPGGLAVDLGASTGHAIQRLAEFMPGRSFRAILVDADQSMLDVAERRLAGLSNVAAEYRRADLTMAGSLEHVEANLTLLLWTLQFLPPTAWLPLLTELRERSAEDGLLVIGAKSRMGDARWQEVADGALVDWKAAHGVSADEVLAKARSLRGTMLQASERRLIRLLDQAGWREPTVLFRWHAWIVLGAWATDG